MSKAALCFTLFSNNNLSHVKGLDSVLHWGPSTIGFDTLEKSDYSISEEFLLGCGLSDNLIAYMLNNLGAPTEPHYCSCFISYSHKDRLFAQQLHADLQANGIRCWLDEHDMLPGDKMRHSIVGGIRMSDKILLCASKHSLDSHWVEEEIEAAFDKEHKRQSLALIPLNLDKHLFSDQCKHDWTEKIRARLAADFRNWQRNNDKYEREFERVLKALRTDRDDAAT